MFAEFADFESVGAFLNADPKPTWEGEELLIMSKSVCTRLSATHACVSLAQGSRLIFHPREAYCEMKIKEKGLTGKAADLRRQNIAGAGRKGFNAFKEMAEKEKKGKGKGKDEEKPKPEIYLDFLGARILVHDEDGGSVQPEDVPIVKGASLRFDGVEGDVSFDEVKVSVTLYLTCHRPLPSRPRPHVLLLFVRCLFPRPSFIHVSSTPQNPDELRNTGYAKRAFLTRAVRQVH